MNKEIVILQAAIKIADIHADHLTATIKEVETFFPVTESFLGKLSRENLYALDFLVNRFARLQDTIGEKIFPKFLILLEEDIKGNSFIDNLNLLEKLNIIPSVRFWKQMRNIRNELTHEYPEFFCLQEISLNHCFEKTKELLIFWEELRSKLLQKLPEAFVE